ncbi:MAG: molecular chaperone DnaJ [Candidatus Limnocylindrales bacterium]
MATSRDYYDVLGVPRDAPDADIKRAFRKLAQQWHPDVNTDPSAPERFKEINEAYQVLSDPQQRRAYDMFGRAGVGTGGAEGYGPFGGFQGFGDLFDAFFGAGAGGAQTRRAHPPAGSDLRYDLSITFEESIRGAEKEIEFSALDRCSTCSGTGAEPGSASQRCPQCNGLGEIRQVRSTMLGQMVNVSVCPKCRGEGSVVATPCHECRGEGRIHRKRKLRVAVPAGIDEGHQMRLTGEGEAGPRGGTAGNLYVAIHIEAHPSLRREGTELFFDLPVSITQAALGARVAVPTAEGEEQVEVKAGTQPGAEIRLRGRGVPNLRRPGVRGDLHVMVDVRVPTRLSKRQRELLEALASESGERPARSGGIFDKVKDAIS